MTWISTAHPIRRRIVTLLTIAMVLVAWPATAAPPGETGGRARQLERLALDLASRLRAVPIRDGVLSDPGRYCPPDRLAVSWTPLRAPSGSAPTSHRSGRPRARPPRA